MILDRIRDWWFRDDRRAARLDYLDHLTDATVDASKDITKKLDRIAHEPDPLAALVHQMRRRQFHNRIEQAGGIPK